MAKSTDSSTSTKTRKASKPAVSASKASRSSEMQPITITPVPPGGSPAISKATSKTQEPQTTRHAANPEDRERMIQTAAYHLAEKDGFPGGREHDYWLQAEAQIDRLLQTSPSGESDQH